MSFVSAFKRWWTDFDYSPYDRRGNAQCLAGRKSDPAQLNLPDNSPVVRDQALELFCDAFNIPSRQMYCLRPEDA